MSMQHLVKYVATKNLWAELSGSPKIEFPLTADNITDLLESIEGELSPENLHCDGEISMSAAQEKARQLYAVQAELLNLRAVERGNDATPAAAKSSRLREEAFRMLADGFAVKYVALALDISYANAHYYKRAWVKANKGAA